MNENPRPKCDFTLHRDRWEQLVLTEPDGAQHAGVTPVRGFPVSDVNHWISICDAQGHEIVGIEDLADVGPELRTTIEEALAQREFVPRIVKILSATPEEPSHWRVLTDRGPTAFEVSSEDDVRRLGPQQASILDSHSVRYLIPDIRRLDAASRRILEHFL